MRINCITRLYYDVVTHVKCDSDDGEENRLKAIEKYSQFPTPLSNRPCLAIGNNNCHGGKNRFGSVGSDIRNSCSILDINYKTILLVWRETFLKIISAVENFHFFERLVTERRIGVYLNRYVFYSFISFLKCSEVRITITIY